MATVLEPIRPVPPMMTIFMVSPPLSTIEAQRFADCVLRIVNTGGGRQPWIDFDVLASGRSGNPAFAKSIAARTPVSQPTEFRSHIACLFAIRSAPKRADGKAIHDRRRGRPGARLCGLWAPSAR